MPEKKKKRVEVATIGNGGNDQVKANIAGQKENGLNGTPIYLIYVRTYWAHFTLRRGALPRPRFLTLRSVFIFRFLNSPSSSSSCFIY